MSNSKALATRPSLPEVWQTIQSISPIVEASRLFGLRQEEVSMKMLVAWEHGVPLTSAMSTVYIIDSKPSLAPKLVWGKVLAHPDFGSYAETRLEEDGQFRGWEITLSRKNGTQATRRFTLDDARRIVVKVKNGKTQYLVDKSNWQNYPENMCYWRAIGYAIDAVFADVAQGLYRPEELGAEVNADGEVIEGQFSVAPVAAAPTPAPLPTFAPAPALAPVKTQPVAPVTAPTPPAPTPPPAPAELTIAGLLALGYTPQQIMEANDNRLPGTTAECEAVKAKLESEAT
jgi:hypothetical protein